MNACNKQAKMYQAYDDYLLLPSIFNTNSIIFFIGTGITKHK